MANYALDGTGGRVMTVMGIMLIVVLVGMFGLGVMSRQAPEPSLVEGKLEPCPARPNCVCSETYAEQSQSNMIDPINIGEGEGYKIWLLFRKAVLARGGVIMYEADSYLHAEFTSMVFRFVDDVEARLDEASGQIHLRSASRIGHSDFGANRRRTENIVRTFEEMR